MPLTDQLSSQVGDRTEAANRRAADRCLAEPALLAEVAAGLVSPDAALVGDCAEVLTMVAQRRPELVAPYAPTLPPFLAHKNTRVRWEAMHALALVAALAADVVQAALPRLAAIIRQDGSVIVRDYAVEALGRYASTGPDAASAAYPLLLEALTAWQGKQAGRALVALAAAAPYLPDRADELATLAVRHHDHARAVVRKAARALLDRVSRATPETS